MSKTASESRSKSDSQSPKSKPKSKQEPKPKSEPINSELPFEAQPRDRVLGLLDPTDDAQQASVLDWLRLSARLHLDPMQAVRRLRETGDPRAALEGCRGRPTPGAITLERWRELLARDGFRLLPLLARGYPERLQAIPDPAALLFVRGDARLLVGRSVAIVGARAATRYGLEVATRLAAALAREGVVVISGLARGVDAAAHRGALEAGGATVAFLACGPDQVYPKEHRGLADDISKAGAIVTEMPPGTPPRAPYFPLRNRLIAGLAELVVVVEARLRSGSLVTARRALDQGGEVMAVPGPITSATSRGSNQLLRDGAGPVLEPEDVLSALGLGRESKAQAKPLLASPRAASAAAIPADGPAARVMASLTHVPESRDALARRLALDAATLASVLTDLQLSGRVVLDRDGRFRTVDESNIMD